MQTKPVLHRVRKLPVLMLALLTLAGCLPNSDTENRINGVARAISRGEAHLTVVDLADRLIKKQESLTLIDIRPPDAFHGSHLEGAKRRDITELLSPVGRNALPQGGKIIVVSAHGVQAAQSVALLRVSGINAYALKGGYSAWHAHMHADAVAEPVNDTEATADSSNDPAQARAEARRRAVACYFEGDYVAAAGLTVKTAMASDAGYTPPLQPVTAPESEDPLGLGLGLGLGDGLPQPAAKKSGGLLVGEGC